MNAQISQLATTNVGIKGKSLHRFDRRRKTMATSTREEIRVGELAIRFLVEGKDSAGSVAVFEFDVPRAAAVAAAHSHDGYEETIYGLEGVLTWTVDGAEIEVGPGEALVIPRGAVHHFDNRGEVGATALAIVTPGILGPDLFREVGAILDAAASGPPDVAAIGKILRRHGLTPAL
jgi:quercetin dioxygenase-like cupin family protein